ncbi:unnamed protein product [Cylicostephanus goldi]|uniref:Reverse transcriptase domain-containing protein n=1 Tax=Cylicostephanus goldi TaxID=71465 RepID=A0A3P7NGN0_CYLGO|nr:unnamed protein product [Cylicostephanus goldi]
MASTSYEYSSTAAAANIRGPVSAITEEEVRIAIRKTKNGKATGPDDILNEFWKMCGQPGIPIWKNGDIADCSTYWPIRLTSDMLKILERVLETRLETS